MKKMRRRLTAIFTALAGAVLATVLVISCYFSINQITRELDRNMSIVMTDAIGFAGDNAFGGSTGKYTEPQPCFVSITNHEGQDLVRPTAANIEARKAVLVQVSEVSMAEGLTEGVQASYGYDLGSGVILSENTEPQEDLNVMSQTIAVNSESFFRVEDPDGDAYLATSFTFSMGVIAVSAVASTYSPDGAPVGVFNEVDPPIYHDYTIALAMPLEGMYRQIAGTVALYVGIFVLGVGLLMLASWFLSGIAVRPAMESMERQTAFIAAASHELRTPIAVAQSCLSASMKVPDEAEAAGYRQSALDELGRMGRLVNDLLLLTRGDSGRWEVALEPVDLDTVLIEAAEQFRPMAKEQGKRLELELPKATLPPVQGDAARLRQVLAVLVDNALQYTPEGSAVTIRAAEKRGKVRLEVADHGPGIPDDEKERVFERFYRAQQSRSDEDHFGLGLSVARELAARHGGTLSVHDTPGGGATFRLCLPAGKTQKTTA